MSEVTNFLWFLGKRGLSYDNETPPLEMSVLRESYERNYVTEDIKQKDITMEDVEARDIKIQQMQVNLTKKQSVPLSTTGKV